MGADSHPSIPVGLVTNNPELVEQKPEKVFQSELFDTYIARVVRKSIAEQFVAPEHQVLVDEDRLIGEAAQRLRDHLAMTASEWQLSCSLTKIIVTNHLRDMAVQRLGLHDIDEEARATSLHTIMNSDFEEIFPKDWLDS